MRKALTAFESVSPRSYPGGGNGGDDDEWEWTEEQLMGIEAYRDLSARWSDLEVDYATLQSESEERAELMGQTIESMTAEVDLILSYIDAKQIAFIIVF